MATFDVDLKGHYFLVGVLAPLMAERGQGAIVNVSRMAAVFGVPGMGVHGAAKAGFNSLAKVWAAEFGSQGVRVNAVVPGTTLTQGTESMVEALDQLAAQSPSRRTPPGTGKEKRWLPL